MNILALDTCTESCSAALLYEGEVFKYFEMTQRGHSELILGMMDNVLSQAGVDISVVDALAFGRGPGSFTGVRVGVGVAQGIAFARDIPVIPISSLAAVAQGAADELDVDHLAVAMDARMGEIYCASYQRENGLVKRMDDERVCPPQDFSPASGPYSSMEWVGVGTGWREYDAILRECFINQLARVSVDHYPRATSIVKLAEFAAEAGQLLSAEQAMPVYLRNNVAKKKGEQ
ncbi:MAG: tRNA (adenosine(37)-N6)-threonylcarbamoyltransferase complex dimerization subunit type 1 TsaB [Pseudomonadota bacterium]|nr:tRNA (adenosine(37)-N6)-threonylcarbamoyltransferase complex dimerization subunit type 1 TsaB [Pseudomonadota bacterium]MDO7710450.1 tRNA (adenosine(37)-N6)-threonylcarbamoyltransferase complex dimerization subunit type 1 TsaB [Pseudomonadota bacterium]